MALLKASPTVHGRKGAASAAHPWAVDAALRALDAGGCAVDGAIAAHAVTCVLLPHAAGLGGDLLALVRTGDGECLAVNGCGAAPTKPMPGVLTEGGTSVTVPGLVSAWLSMHERWGRLPLETLLEPAITLARDGIIPGPSLSRAAHCHRDRLDRYGAMGWPHLDQNPWQQPALARLLGRVSRGGRSAFYEGDIADAVVSAAEAGGGTLSLADLSAHKTEVCAPLTCELPEGTLLVQPPPTQGVILARSLRWLTEQGPSVGEEVTDHLLVELAEAAFLDREGSRRGAALLDTDLQVLLGPARRRGGPRGYLHTAATAVADRDGMTVSSLISVFDQFGSGVFVPEAGIILNNRAAGFTSGENAYQPGGHPVHTLAPAMIASDRGSLALATPGADGQVQTLLQVIVALIWRGAPLDEAISALRWRSQDAELLVERGHPAGPHLRESGHVVRDLDPGNDLFGAVAAAGWHHGIAFAAADWRRTNSAAAI